MISLSFTDNLWLSRDAKGTELNRGVTFAGISGSPTPSPPHSVATSLIGSVTNTLSSHQLNSNIPFRELLLQHQLSKREPMDTYNSVSPQRTSADRDELVSHYQERDRLIRLQQQQQLQLQKHQEFERVNEKFLLNNNNDHLHNYVIAAAATAANRVDNGTDTENQINRLKPSPQSK